MAGEKLRKELFEELNEGVVEFDEELVKTAAQWVLAEGLNAYNAVMNGLAAGIERVGELYDQQEYFVPELLMCAVALYVELDILKPYIKAEDIGTSARDQMVIGTVQGDVHDIDKNIIKMMFKVAGFTVHDLGRDVPLEKFVEEQLKTNSEIVALSAMMTTTMMSMEKVIQMIKEKNPNVQIMLSGSPMTSDVATLFGADGYAESAGNAVQEAVKMIANLRKLQNQ